MNNFLWAFFYIAIITISSVFFAIRTKNEKLNILFSILCILIPAVVAAIRFEVGTDYINYVKIYTYISHTAITEVADSVHVLGAGGVGLWLIGKIAQMLGGVIPFFGIISLLSLFFVKEGVEFFKCKNRFVTWFLVLLTFYPTSLNIVKQSLAMAIVFYGLRFVVKGEPIKYCIAVACAMTIHSTAIIAIPIYFIRYFMNGTGKNRIYPRYPWPVIPIYSFLLVFLGCLLFKPIATALGSTGLIAGSLASSYINGSEGSRNLSFFIELILFCILLIFSKRLVVNDRNNKLLIIIMGIGTGLSAVGFFSIFIKRVAMFYYLFPEQLLIAQIPECCTEKNITKKAVLLIVLIFTIARFLLTSIIMGQGDIVPYKCVLF